MFFTNIQNIFINLIKKDFLIFELKKNIFNIFKKHMHIIMQNDK